MCKKIYIILFLIVFMVGCSEKKETNIRESFVDKDWYRPTDVCGENLCFASDGTFWYYEDCGSAVEDYDCYDEYSYDKKTGIITLHEIDGGDEREMEVISCENDVLVLKINGEIREFENVKELSNEEIEPIELVNNAITTEYDITGDGGNDTIQIICTEIVEEYGDEQYGTKWCIQLNGKDALTVESEIMEKLEVQLYQVSDERNYLFVKQHIDTNDDIIGASLYRIVGDNIVEEFDFYNMLLENINEFHSRIDISFMSEESLRVSCTNQFYATARMNWDMNYKYERAQESWIACEDNYLFMYDESLEYKAVGMTANQDFLVYEDWTCKAEAFTVKKGEVVHLSEMRFYKGETYFHVENAEGNQGWFVDPDRVGKEIGDNWIYGYFEEALFAG